MTTDTPYMEAPPSHHPSSQTTRNNENVITVMTAMEDPAAEGPPAAPPPSPLDPGTSAASSDADHHYSHPLAQQQQQQQQQQQEEELVSAASAAAAPSTELMLQTAANAAAAQQPTSASSATTISTGPPDAMALAAMQEAATIVMEAQQRQQQRQQQQEQQQDEQPQPPPSSQAAYTYAAANAAYSPSMSATTTKTRNILSNHEVEDSNDSTAQNVAAMPTHTTNGAATEPTLNAQKKRPNPSATTPADATTWNGGQEGAGDYESAYPPPDDEPSKKRPALNRVSWEERIEQLKEYTAKHGDLLIPIRYKPSNLGKFVHNTREQYKLYHKQTPEGYKKKCSLTAARIEQLNELGFAWTTERSKRQNDDWRRRLDQLKEFKRKHGHCLVPHGYPEDPSFAEWIHRQRTSYNTLLKEEEDEDEAAGEEPAASKSSTPAVSKPMMKARFEQLKDLGFNFTVHSDKWMDHWNQLKAYKEKHGDCQVPTHYTENPRLGRWVHTQRHQRRLQAKGKRSCMTPERIDLLNQLGFSWEVRPSLERPRATWHQRLEELQEFHQRHGHFRVDATDMPQLHSWCYEQRQRLRLLDKNNGDDVTKRMNPDRVQALHAIGFTKEAKINETGGGVATKATEGSNMDPDSFAHMDEQALGAAMVDAALDTADGSDAVEV